MRVTVFTNFACDALSELVSSVPHLHTPRFMIHFDIAASLSMWKKLVD